MPHNVSFTRHAIVNGGIPNVSNVAFGCVQTSRVVLSLPTTTGTLCAYLQFLQDFLLCVDDFLSLLISILRFNIWNPFRCTYLTLIGVNKPRLLYGKPYRLNFIACL